MAGGDARPTIAPQRAKPEKAEDAVLGEVRAFADEKVDRVEPRPRQRMAEDEADDGFEDAAGVRGGEEVDGRAEDDGGPEDRRQPTADGQGFSIVIVFGGAPPASVRFETSERSLMAGSSGCMRR